MPRRIALDLDAKLWVSFRHVPDPQTREWIGRSSVAACQSRPPQPAPHDPSYKNVWRRAGHVVLCKPCCRLCAISHSGEEPLCFNV